ncbi:MAG: penicillin-binding protein 2 [Myxococcaceae bacterium]
MTLKIRLSLILAILGLSLSIALTKAGILQLVRGPALKELAERQHTRTTQYSNFRGDIVDRKGRLLATSVGVHSLYAEPRRMNHPDQVAKVLKQAVPSLSHIQLERLSSDRSFVWLSRRLDPNISQRVQDLKLEGIGISSEEQRFYPNHGLLGQTLGSVSIDGKSIGGIEQAFVRYLKPKTWDTLSLQDARGKPIRSYFAPDQEDLWGDKITLTIDRNIQFIAEEVLSQTVQAHGARGGWAIVMRPKTGEILALATVPLMNPNKPEKNSTASRNNPISRTGEPGSTFKIVTFAAAFDLGLLQPDEKIYCEKGIWKLDHVTIRDVSKKEFLTPTEIFQYSSNIGTYKIAQRVGKEKLYEMIKRLGFGELPGLNLLEEAKGFVSKPESWGQARFVNVSFGYGIMASSLQMATMVSTIANGGIKVAPQILKNIQKTNGEIYNPLPTYKPTRVLSEQAAKALTQMMIHDTQGDGSGKRAAIPGILVAGKTGTAEKLDASGHYAKNLNLSSFAGFAPADNPEIVALVTIDEPKGIAFGGYVAAPAWRQIVEAALIQLNNTVEDQP